MDPGLQIRMIPHGGPDYQEMVALRYAILREPLGLKFTEEELESEKEDLLVGGFGGVDPASSFLLGCFVLRPGDAGWVRLRQMAVREDFRGKGIGSALLRYAEELALQRGFHTLMLHARQGASRFYLASGYQPAGQPFLEVGIPHIEMRKSLL